MAGRIDSSLQTLHVDLYYQLNQTRQTLTKTRNRLASSIYCLPEEVLFEIFMDVIYTPDASYSDSPPDMMDRVRNIYHNLYNIFGVCTAWRDICLARPILWLTIPMTDSLDNSWRSLSAELCRERNMLSSNRMAELKDIAKHLSRTRTLNVHSESPLEIREILGLVLEHATPEHISQLSLRFLPRDEDIHHGTSERDVFNQKNSPLRPYLARVFSSLSSLRVSNICWDWEFVAFSARLVKLRMDMIMFPGNSAIIAFMTSLSSACELRDLQIIRVEAFASQGSVLPRGPHVSLSKLQSLHLKGLRFNFINLFLIPISPTSYRLTLNPSSKATLLRFSKKKCDRRLSPKIK
ncbi:hypothetical protein B0J17DRAFT_709558 [Rhizoctonia solani]|nr:hypothetical protein B0J17DRAFT_709558 [Rhizoctonia solani]